MSAVVVVVGDVDRDGDGDVIGKTSTSTDHVGEYPVTRPVDRASPCRFRAAALF